MSDKTSQPSSKVPTLLFAIIILAALAVRLWGITWGLPDSLHYFSFHPDETLILSYCLPDFGGINVFAGHILPGRYNYGSFPFYEIHFFLTLAGGYHYLGPVYQHGVVNPQNFAKALLIARLLSVALGVGTVWAAYALARRLFGEWSGLAAAAFLAVMPLHAQHSHYATVDIGAAFWQTLSMVYAAKVIGATKWTLKYTILAGVTAGLCAATKYSGALVMLSLFAALYFRCRESASTRQQVIRLGAIASLTFLVTFILACPGSVFQTSVFLADVSYESNHVMHHGEDYFKNTGPGWIYIVTRNLDAGMGLPLLLLSGAGIIWGCVKRRPGDSLLAIYALPTYLILGAAQSRYARYEIALLPILAIFAARFIVDSISNVDMTTALKTPVRIAASIIGILILAFTAVDTWDLLLPMSQQDPRERAAIWINSHFPQATIIATGSDPWFYTATLNPYFGWYIPHTWQKWAPGDVSKYCYNQSKWFDPSSIDSCNAPVTTISEIQYYDPMRLGYKESAQYFADLKAKYGPPIVFESYHPFGGLHEIGGLPTQDLPPDMLYPSPTVLVYAKH